MNAKHLLRIAAVCALMWSAAGVQAAETPMAAQHQAGQGGFFSRIGDWFATVGKPQAEKDQILAERRAKRAAEEMEEEAREAAERAERDAKKAADEAQEQLNREPAAPAESPDREESRPALP